MTAIKQSKGDAKDCYAGKRIVTRLTLPRGYETLPVQLPLFVEHSRMLRVNSVALKNDGHVFVKWKGVDEDALQGEMVTETFDLAQRRGRVRLKDFLLAVTEKPANGTVDLDDCLGHVVDHQAQRPRFRVSIDPGLPNKSGRLSLDVRE